MAAEDTLDTALNAHGALTILVGDQIYRLRFPQGATYPLVVFQRVFTTREQAVTGAVMSRSIRFQITCYAEGSREATTVAETVEDALVAEGIARFADVTLRDEKAFWHPDAELYSQIVECDCLEAA